MTSILIVPDAHAVPGLDNERFSWIGQQIVRLQPDIVVCVGDFADMASLSGYDKGKKSFEGRRYHLDVDACRDALNRLHVPLDKHNQKLRAKKKAPYNPRLVMCLGNHEGRIDRAVNSTPELEGTISVDDLHFKQHGWEVVPYEESIEICGFQFSHHFASGVSGRPISGVNHAASLLGKLHTSAVVGHSHCLDFAVHTRPDGRKIVGLVVGCMSHPDQVEGWNRATHRLWWRGLTYLRGARDGWAKEFRFIGFPEE